MKLNRSRDDSRIAGVCGGLAEHFELPSSKLRVVWVLGTLFSAAFPDIFLYLALWYLMPKEPPPARRVAPSTVAALEEDGLEVMAENESTKILSVLC